MTNHLPETKSQRPPSSREAAEDFVTTAVHDLKESLRSIRMGADLCAPDAARSADEAPSRGHQFITHGLQRAETLIRDIAAYCYQNLEQVELEPVSLDLVLKEAIREADQDLQSCSARVVCDPLPDVRGMPGALTTVFVCLLRNSCKFRSSAPPLFRITASPIGQEWIVSLCDNGIGIEPIHAERIFRPFEKLHGSKYPGSGLGLTLARLIVEQHGGAIWAESRVGQGATINIRLSGFGNESRQDKNSRQVFPV